MQTHDFLRIQRRAAKQNLYCKISKNHSDAVYEYVAAVWNLDKIH